MDLVKYKYIAMLEETLQIYKDKVKELQNELSLYKLQKVDYQSTITPKVPVLYTYDSYSPCTCSKGNCCTDPQCAHKSFGEYKGY